MYECQHKIYENKQNSFIYTVFKKYSRKAKAKIILLKLFSCTSHKRLKHPPPPRMIVITPVLNAAE